MGFDSYLFSSVAFPPTFALFIIIRCNAYYIPFISRGLPRNRNIVVERYTSAESQNIFSPFASSSWMRTQLLLCSIFLLPFKNLHTLLLGRDDNVIKKGCSSIVTQVSFFKKPAQLLSS